MARSPRQVIETPLPVLAGPVAVLRPWMEGIATQLSALSREARAQWRGRPVFDDGAGIVWIVSNAYNQGGAWLHIDRTRPAWAWRLDTTGANRASLLAGAAGADPIVWVEKVGYNG